MTASGNEEMTTTERPEERVKTQSMGMQWTGRVLSGLTILFMLFDAFGKFAKPVQVTDAFARLGLPLSMAPSIGILLLIGTLLYTIPRTAVLGAVLLTGCMGGAVAIQMRAGSSIFEQVFPVLLGIVMWAGLHLRDCGLRRVFPVRC